MKVLNPKLRYVVYARKSTDTEERQAQSIEDQLRELKPIIEDNNLTVVGYFKESKSAKRPGRPQFNEMMEIIRKGKADGIICWKINRLARNPSDGGLIQWMLQESTIKSIVTPNKEHFPADNVLMLGMELGMANQYSLDLSRDVIRGMNSKVRKGFKPSKAPIGYLNDPLGLKGEKQIFIDQDRFPLVRKLWDLLLTGNYTVKQIRDISITEWGLKTRGSKNVPSNYLTLSGYYKIFNNPFYYGEFEYKGELMEGSQEIMITKEEFDRAQKILGRAGKPRPKYKRLPFNGIIKCGVCGSMITCDEKVKRSRTSDNVIPKIYLYHRCTKSNQKVKCEQKPITFDELNQQAQIILDSITIPEEYLKWAIEVLQSNDQLEESNRKVILKNLRNNYDGVVSRIQNLLHLYTSPENDNREIVSDEEYKLQKNTLIAEKSRIEGQLRNSEEDINKWVDLTEETFNFATYAKIHFDNGDYETKTNILRSVGQNFTLTDRRLNIELKKPFLIIKDGLKSIELDKVSVEHNKLANSAMKQKKKPEKGSDFFLWSG